MIFKIFAVRDRATDQFGNPMFLVSTGQAIRSFTDEVNRQDKESQIFQHPEDFDLYELGVYNTNSGLFETGVPQQVCIGKNVAVRS